MAGLTAWLLRSSHDFSGFRTALTNLTAVRFFLLGYYCGSVRFLAYGSVRLVSLGFQILRFGSIRCFLVYVVSVHFGTVVGSVRNRFLDVPTD